MLDGSKNNRIKLLVTLRRNEKLFRGILSFISDHIYVSDVTDPEQPVNLYISPHVETMTGYPVERFMADWSFWPLHIIHPEDQSVAAVQAARLRRGEDSEVEYRIIHLNDEIRWVRDRARVRTEGNSTIVYGLVSDITHYKQTELEREWLNNELRNINQTLDERVRARTAEMRAILDAVGEGIVVTDVEGVIKYINPALKRMSGYSEKESLGRTPRLWKSGQHDHGFYLQMWETILSGQIWRGELINKRKDGSLYEVVLTITPISGPNGKPFGFVGAQHDITPFKEMDRLKSEFISTAAHELRTPLTSIQGFSEILATRHLDEKRQAQYLNFINQQAQALKAIIDDLLDLSRLESKQGFQIAEMEVDLRQVIEEVVFGFQENYPDHQYRIDGPAEWPILKGDPVKLAQVFKNLFSNATKYSPQGGEIVLRAQVHPEYHLVYLALSDPGIGMTPEQLSQVFNRFYRADASSTAVGGTGLGMTISRLIVIRHRGKIWIESEYGQGTIVHIFLPLPERSPHILIIEDDEALQAIQKRSLELNKYIVFSAEEGETGLELAQICLPDLILLDLALPGMNGFTVLDKLQANEITADIPVIITSAMDKPEKIEKAIARGVMDFLVKPYGMNDLMVRVNRALAKVQRDPPLIY